MEERPQAAEQSEEAELTEAVRLANVIQYAFDGDAARFAEFCGILEEALPPGTYAIVRGSAVTGYRWKNGVRFDADGYGTSDLDLTLVGAEAIKLFTLTGFYVPGIHSVPLSDDHPDIAPDLAPLRERLMAIAKRPVNIQATTDLVKYLRGDLLGQPYVQIAEKPKAS